MLPEHVQLLEEAKLRRGFPDRDAVRETSSVRPLTETELRTVARDDMIRHGAMAAFDDPNAEAIVDTAVEMMEAFLDVSESQHMLVFLVLYASRPLYLEKRCLVICMPRGPARCLPPSSWAL